MSQVIRCWCGNAKEFAPFSDDYYRCSRCNTLVSTARLSDEALHVKHDDLDFYGREYWLSHQTEDYGHPDIYQRARDDLPERCLHWMGTLLKYRLPPARVLELGAAHGGFVGLLRMAGFDATGLEISPWVVEFARKAFDVPMLLGPVEEQALPPHSLDIIALMDVLEHLPDPTATMAHCLNLLKPDGLLLIQTPHYAGVTYADMQAVEDRFLLQLKAAEHLYLFSEDAIRFLFERLEAGEIAFEPALFDYDMFLVVSRKPLRLVARARRDESLEQTPAARLVLALLDLYERASDLQHACDERQKVINEQAAEQALLYKTCEERLRLIQSQDAELKRLRHTPE